MNPRIQFQREYEIIIFKGNNTEKRKNLIYIIKPLFVSDDDKNQWGCKG